MPPHVSSTNIMQLLGAYGLADLDKGKLLPGPFTVAAKTAAYTILPTDRCGTLFTNRGAAGSVTFTLPGPTAVPAGTWFLFGGIADQNIVVAPPAVDTLITLNDAASDSLAMSTAGQKIGGLMLAFSDGTAWVAVGLAVGVTFTAAT